jgi:hypothetical protein
MLIASYFLFQFFSHDHELMCKHLPTNHDKHFVRKNEVNGLNVRK